MKCYVYRSRRKDNTYLYLSSRDGFEPVPEALLRMFGAADFSLEFELTPERKLVIADAVEVIRQLDEQGYYLQLPPANTLSI